MEWKILIRKFGEKKMGLYEEIFKGEKVSPSPPT